VTSIIFTKKSKYIRHISEKKEKLIAILYGRGKKGKQERKEKVKKIRGIFSKQEVRGKIDGTRAAVENRANRLLYAGVRHPNRLYLFVLRLIMKYYDKAR